MQRNRERCSWKVAWDQTHEDSECPAEEIRLDSLDNDMSIKVLDKVSGQQFLLRGSSSSVLPSEERRTAVIQGTDFEFLVHLKFLFTDQVSLHIIFRTFKMAATGKQYPKQKKKGTKMKGNTFFSKYQLFTLGFVTDPRTEMNENLPKRNMSVKS